MLLVTDTLHWQRDLVIFPSLNHLNPVIGPSLNNCSFMWQCLHAHGGRNIRVTDDLN